MADFVTVSDLQVFEPGIDVDKAEAMIADATALALTVAPCIGAADFENTAAVLAVLRGAILRWNDSGNGAVSAQSAGPFSQTLDTRQERRGMFWPTEITQLQGLCGSVGGSVYSVSLAGPDPEPGDGIVIA